MRLERLLSPDNAQGAWNRFSDISKLAAWKLIILDRDEP